MACNRFLLTKIVQLTIIVVCFILWESINGALTTYKGLVAATLGGFAIVCGVLVVGNIINSEIDKRLNGLFSIIGCIMFVVAGSLIIHDWYDRSDFLGLFKDDKHSALAVGALMIINAIIFLTELVLVFLN